MVERITVTGRIVDDECELMQKAHGQLHSVRYVPLSMDVEMGDRWPDADYGRVQEIERRMLLSMRIPKELL